MLIGLIGENCSGKSTLASLLKELARLKEEIAKKPRRVKEKFKENVR